MPPVLAAKLQMISGWQSIRPLPEPSLNILHDAGYVVPLSIASHEDVRLPSSRLMIFGLSIIPILATARSGSFSRVGESMSRFAQLRWIGPQRRIDPHDHVEDAVAFVYLSDGPPFQQCLNSPAQLGDGKTIAGRFSWPQQHFNLWHVHLLFDTQIGNAGDVMDGVGNARCLVPQLVQVWADNANHDVGRCARKNFVDAFAKELLHCKSIAGHVAERRVRCRSTWS